MENQEIEEFAEEDNTPDFMVKIYADLEVRVTVDRLDRMKVPMPVEVRDESGETLYLKGYKGGERTRRYVSGLKQEAERHKLLRKIIEPGSDTEASLPGIVIMDVDGPIFVLSGYAVPRLPVVTV